MSGYCVRHCSSLLHEKVAQMMAESEDHDWDWWAFFFDWFFAFSLIWGAVLVAAYFTNIIERPQGVPFPGYGPTFGSFAITAVWYWLKRWLS